MMSQVRNPQCFVGFGVSGTSFSGVSAVVGQAYFVRQSIRRIPSLKERNFGAPIYVNGIEGGVPRWYYRSLILLPHFVVDHDILDHVTLLELHR
jgi:hypothetical protein